MSSKKNRHSVPESSGETLFLEQARAYYRETKTVAENAPLGPPSITSKPPSYRKVGNSVANPLRSLSKSRTMKSKKRHDALLDVPSEKVAPRIRHQKEDECHRQDQDGETL
jgi:hypothetical protein